MLLLSGSTALLCVIMLVAGSAWAGLAFGLATLTGLVLYGLARLGQDRIVAHGTPLALLTVTLLLAVTNGSGLGAPVLVALPLVPVMAFFAGGGRTALGWAIPTLAAPGVLFLLEPLLPEPGFDPALGLVLHTFALTLATLSITAFTWYFDRQRRLREAALEEARREAEEANTAKGNFLAAMSHEIRTPLGGILGVVELLDMADLGERESELVAIAGRSGEDLLAMLDQLLQMSRLEAGRLDLELRPDRPARILEDVVFLHRAGSARQGVPVELHVDPDAAGAASVDPLRFRQIAQNLIGNALKFTHEGRVTARLSRDGEDWVLCVEDTGIGIPAAALPTLFDPFRQAEEGTARRYGGSGLGLAIVARLSEAMGGEVTVSSTPGQGSTFTVRLPLAELDDAAVPDGAWERTSHTRPPLSLDVLIVDDNAVNRMVLGRLARALGCEVAVADSGPAALDYLEGHSPDVVCMDIQMPGMDGIEATERLRRTHTVPVLALTASATDDVRQRARAAGMGGLLTKPVAPDALYDALLGVARPDARSAEASD